MTRSRSAQATPGPRTGRERLVAAGGLIALLGGFAVVMVTSGGSGQTQQQDLQAATAAVEPTPTTPTSAPVRLRAAIHVAVRGLGAYDPEGDGSENDGDARFATDGNRATAWKSERYRSAFTKSGVGLIVDAGRPVLARRLTVTSDAPGYTAQVEVGSSTKGPFVAISGTRRVTARTTFALRGRRARYLMLWIMSMPASGAAAVNEITVTGDR